MIKEKNAWIVLEVFNTYREKLSERIGESDMPDGKDLYVGDCVEYALELLKKNNSSPEEDIQVESYGIVEDTLRLFFLGKGINGDFCWSQDKKYISRQIEQNQ